jgi:predicted MFS family arabinose efflux permease
MFFPASIGILTAAVPSGRTRNVGFSCLSLAQPVGLQVGLLLAGVFGKDALSWRFGFYLCAGVMLLCIVIAFVCIPPDWPREMINSKRLKHGIDWLGILISSVALGLLSYVLAYAIPRFIPLAKANSE